MDTVSYFARAIRWNPLGIAAALACAIVALRHNSDAAAPLQITAILLASAAGFVFDDPAGELLDTAPPTLLRRRLARLTVVAVPTIGLWVVLFFVQGPGSSEEACALTAMFAGLLGLAVGIAGVANRRTNSGNGGLAEGPALLIALFASTALPPRWRPLPMGDIPGGWAAIDIRWITASLIGVSVFVWSSRDRARRSAVKIPARWIVSSRAKSSW